MYGMVGASWCPPAYWRCPWLGALELLHSNPRTRGSEIGSGLAIVDESHDRPSVRAASRPTAIATAVSVGSCDALLPRQAAHLGVFQHVNQHRAHMLLTLSDLSEIPPPFLCPYPTELAFKAASSTADRHER